jgi:large subunit ribosomal protein L7e
MSVPESVIKKQQTQKKLQAEADAAATAAKADRKEKRKTAYANAKKYCAEYRALAKQRVRMHRQAKAAGNHFVEGEAKLIFVVRIRGLADMHPKTKKILKLMRLIQMNIGVFVKASKASLEMLKRVEPYLSYGYPSLKSVRDLIYKRGFGKINKQRLPLTDNAVVERGLGKYGIMCMEDLVHEIYTVGPHFREANNFLWPFKLRPAKGGQAKKRKGFCEGGQAGNREELMSQLIQRML